MAAAALFAVVVWWGATQALMLLVRRASPRALNAFALTLGVVAALAAMAAARHEGVLAVYAGFAAGIGLWGAFEVTFLSGALVGVESRAASPAIGPRAWAAFRSIIWHELALLATLGALAAALLGMANPVALWTFALLYVMRASAKLNLFLGVRNLCTEFLPAPVRHLAAHFRRADLNVLFPVSVLAGTLAAAFLLRAGLAPDASPGQSAAALLLAALVALGTFEHWLMLTPLSPLNLWSTDMGRVTLARQLGRARLTHT